MDDPRFVIWTVALSSEPESAGVRWSCYSRSFKVAGLGQYPQVVSVHELRLAVGSCKAGPTFDEAAIAVLEAEIFKALGNPLRVQVLKLLQPGPRAVSEILAVTRASPSTVSTHLAALKRSGFVRTERRSSTVQYLLSDSAATEELLSAVRLFLQGAARRQHDVLASLDDAHDDDHPLPEG